jgi:hypothetical protein
MLKILAYLTLWSLGIVASVSGFTMFAGLAITGMVALIVWRHHHRLPSRSRRAKRRSLGRVPPDIAKLPL